MRRSANPTGAVFRARRQLTLVAAGLALLFAAPACGPRSIPQRLQELPPDFKRVPYVQSMTPSQTAVVWQTHSPEASLLRYWQGDSAGAILKGDSTVAIDHVILLDGLAPDTEYSYQVQTWEGRFTDAHPFHTPSRPGTRKSFKFLVFGDSGEGTDGQLQLADRMPGENAALAIHVGDVAYDNGTDVDFDFRHFAVYKDLLGGVPFYPSLGNHDIRTELGRPYLNAFVLPANGPDGTERSYSFQWDDVFFVALDSNTGPTYVQRFGDLRDTQSAQFRWLEGELRQARGDPTVDWIVVYMHHPPFSSGSGIGGHGSDLALRQALQPLLDRYEVDLVFTGHDHHYERSFPIRCREGEAVTEACLVRGNDPGVVTARKGTVHVVTGGGGGPFAWRAVGVSWWTAFARQVYEYVTVEVSAEALVVKSLDVAGATIDEVRIERPAEAGAGQPAGDAAAEGAAPDSAGARALLNEPETQPEPPADTTGRRVPPDSAAAPAR